MKNFALLAILMFLSTNVMAVNCHEVVGNKILSLAQDSYLNQRLSKPDLHWLDRMVEVAVNRADGNNFSCSFINDGIEQTSVSSIILAQKDAPKSVQILILRNEKLLSSLVSGKN